MTSGLQWPSESFAAILCLLAKSWGRSWGVAAYVLSTVYYLLSTFYFLLSTVYCSQSAFYGLLSALYILLLINKNLNFFSFFLLFFLESKRKRSSFSFKLGTYYADSFIDSLGRLSSVFSVKLNFHRFLFSLESTLYYLCEYIISCDIRRRNR